MARPQKPKRTTRTRTTKRTQTYRIRIPEGHVTSFVVWWFHARGARIAWGGRGVASR